MADDSEPRIARIRENLVDGIGPFELMADIIVSSQHSPNNSGLFGIVQSPIRPLRPPVPSTTDSSSSSGTSTEPRLTAKEMAQKMQSIVDAPLSTIETNLPFKKNQERKSNALKNADLNTPSTSAVNSVNSGGDKPSTSSGHTDNSSSRKRKRKRSECSGNMESENWQKPCTSNAKIEIDNGQITINDLFGEEKRQNGTEKRRVTDELRHMGKSLKREKEEQESPDSGYADEVSDNNREQGRHPRLQSIIGEVGRISPLLTPPRQPQKNEYPTLPCFPAVFAPSRVLSPPARPTSRNEFERTLQSTSSERTLLSSKLVTSCGSSNSSNFVSNKRRNAHSSSATPTSSSSAKDFKKDSASRDNSTCSDHQREETTAEKNTNLKIKLVKKLNKKHDKTYVSSPVPSSDSSKANGKRSKNDESTIAVVDNSDSTEQLKIQQVSAAANISNQKKYSQTKFQNSGCSSKSDENSKGKEKKKRSDREHTKMKVVRNQKEDGEQQLQSGNTTAIETSQLRDSKKNSNGEDVRNALNRTNDNREKVVKNSKTTDDKAISIPKRNEVSPEGTQKVGDFCCASRTAPSKKVELEKNEDGTYKSAVYYLERIARPLKQKAEKESGDNVRKTLAYMDAVAYYILSSAIQPPADSREQKQRQYSAARESAELMKTIIRWSNAPPSSLSSLERHFTSRFKLLSLRIQAILNFFLYSLKTPSCMSNFGLLAKWEPLLLELDSAAARIDGAASASSQSGSTNTATPSPASSINSGNGERLKEISVPVVVYQVHRAQVSILHHLMWSVRLWSQNSTNMESVEKEMVEHLDQICGKLSCESDLYATAEYLATAACWLRAEYKAEKERLSSAPWRQHQQQ